ncbi:MULTISPECIES: hypothetical protein [unclassified Guyparkeria]|uniref:hypothetical protein n=1 Tax=unclassified Guyparkeria TaxID=2626246 RepID=UPI00073348E5|nr:MULTISPECIES: hypothetical protein [unclassified Guyparkeria]KTG17134.1 hypothetical protein AUR63_10335 [Guyparkeria sp. XI15]OAE86669.1 hypothetical protein AWR35_10350 [Guyparkeria sp. WRN-7]
MRLVVPVLFSLLLAAVNGSVAAKSVEGRFVAFGPGNWSCEDAVAVAQGNHPGSQGRLDGFIAGYLTATNVILRNTYDIQAGKSDAAGKRQVLAFCRDNPSVRLSNALAVHTQRQYPDRHSVPKQD